jgi:hypothetical protein
VSPAGFGCEASSVDIRTLPDDVTEPGVQGTKVDSKPYLLAVPAAEGAAQAALYCATPPDSFKADLMKRLLQ